jgi:hypothetical protein
MGKNYKKIPSTQWVVKGKIASPGMEDTGETLHFTFLAELRSGRRKRKVSKGRRFFCRLAAGKMGYPGGGGSAVSGGTIWAVLRAAYSEELPALQKYL